MENNYLKFLITEDVYVIDESSADLTKQGNSKAENDEPGVVNEPVSEAYSKNIPFKGNNTSAILILNHEKDVEFISEQDMAFLKNILSAVKLDIEHVALVNLAKLELDLDAIIKELKPNTVIGFGVAHIEQLKTISLYEVSTQQEHKMLLADNLKHIESDKSKKKALWEGLQELFLK